MAQNFFEAPASVEESGAPSAERPDSSVLRIVLTSTTPPARTSRIQIVEAKAVPKFNERARKDDAKSGRWAVQVGSFNKRSDAREQISIVEKQFGKHFDDARAVAEKDDGKYRARFSGFSEKNAKAACQALKAKRQPCMILPPRG